MAKGKKYGFIDNTGNTVIPLAWDGAWGFSEGLAAVNRDATDYQGWTATDGKWGFIDRSGKLAIPCKWEATGFAFFDGLVAVRQGNLWGFIDKTGKLVIPCSWQDIRLPPFYGGSGKTFYDGLVAVKQVNLWGFIDETGRLVIPCRWDYAGDFSDGYAVVRKGSRLGHIRKDGTVLAIENDRGYSAAEYLARTALAPKGTECTWIGPAAVAAFAQ